MAKLTIAPFAGSNKVDAIKSLRAITDFDLRDSKIAIDAGAEKVQVNHNHPEFTIHVANIQKQCPGSEVVGDNSRIIAGLQLVLSHCMETENYSMLTKISTLLEELTND